MMSNLHNQLPTSHVTAQDYDTLLAHLGEQLAARCRAEGFLEDQAADAACDALTNTFQTADDQTVLDWLTAAGKRLGVSTAECVGA